MSQANRVPIFPDVPILGVGEISVANTNLDGSGTLVTVATGTPNGTQIDLIRVKAIVTTTIGMVRLFIEDGGVTFTALWLEIPVTAAVPADDTEAFSADIDLTANPLDLPDGYKLRASTEKGEAMTVFAHGGNF